jgi:hypothetical protein
MSSIYSSLTLGSAQLTLVGHLMARENIRTNRAPPEAAAQARPSAEVEAVQQLHLAHSSIDSGRRNEVPEVLITAARIPATQGPPCSSPRSSTAAWCPTST